MGIFHLSSIAFALASVCSICSGDLSQRASQASSWRFVTPYRSGPSLSPPPIVWHARHLDSKSSLARIASGSVGVAVAGMLWCSESPPGGAPAAMMPTAPCEALAKWWSTIT